MPQYSGYRQRAVNRFLKDGLDSMDEVHALELLLFFGFQDENTTLLAHELINHFGSLAHVMEAPAEELGKVPGMSEHAATLISLVTAISRYCMIRHNEAAESSMTGDACSRYIMSYFYGRRDEVVFLLCLDSKGSAICCRQVGQGTVNSAGVSVRRIVEIALNVNAAMVILAHNHPGGPAIPSGEDVVTTRRLARTLDAVGVRLVDHYVVADNDCISMVRYGYYCPDECYAMA